MKNLAFILFLFLISCSGKSKQPDQSADIPANQPADNYYFPVKDLQVQKTYTYKAKPPITLRDHWKMKVTIVNNDTLLETTIIDNFDRINDQITERMVNGKAYIHAYTASILTFVGTESSMVPVECEVLDSLVYDPQQKIGETIQWKVRYKSSEGHSYTTIAKKRTLKSISDTQKTFSDVMITDVGTSQHVETPVTSVYERNKGLISYKITFSGNVVHDFVLETIK